MRAGGMLGVAMLAAVFPASAGVIDTRQLFDALNSARADPAGFRDGLRAYRGFFHANLLRYPGSVADIATEEGVAVVDETIAFLGRQPPLARLLPSPMLQQSAAAHVADQGRTGGIGHAGSDGSSPRLRVQRLGGGAYVAEVISYGSIDPTDAIRQLIVDDGVADRGHREVIYSAELRYAGAACGPHPVYRTVCVVDLGITPDGHYRDNAGGSAQRARKQLSRASGLCPPWPDAPASRKLT